MGKKIFTLYHSDPNMIMKFHHQIVYKNFDLNSEQVITYVVCWFLHEYSKWLLYDFVHLVLVGHVYLLALYYQESPNWLYQIQNLKKR